MNRTPGASLDDATISSLVSYWLVANETRLQVIAGRRSPHDTICEWFIV